MSQTKKQTIAHFRIRILEILVYLIILLLGIVILTIYPKGNTHSWRLFFFPLPIVLSLLSLLQLLWYIFKPYVSISNESITLYPGVFLKSRNYAFNEIVKIVHVNPESKIEFHIKNGGKIQLPFYRLSKKDRIRFVFLLESDINRKHTVMHEE